MFAGISFCRIIHSCAKTFTDKLNTGVFFVLYLSKRLLFELRPVEVNIVSDVSNTAVSASVKHPCFPQCLQIFSE